MQDHAFTISRPRRQHNGSETFVELFAVAEKMEIKINEAKTKNMVTGSAAPRLRQNITMEEWNFEVAKDFKYLGSVLTADNEVRMEVNDRLAAGSR